MYQYGVTILLKTQNLLEKYGYVFVKYEIHSLNDLTRKGDVQFNCRPIDRNVIIHACELYNAQSDTI